MDSIHDDTVKMEQNLDEIGSNPKTDDLREQYNKIKDIIENEENGCSMEEFVATYKENLALEPIKTNYEQDVDRQIRLQEESELAGETLEDACKICGTRTESLLLDLTGKDFDVDTIIKAKNIIKVKSPVFMVNLLTGKPSNGGILSFIAKLFKKEIIASIKSKTVMSKDAVAEYLKSINDTIFVYKITFSMSAYTIRYNTLNDIINNDNEIKQSAIARRASELLEGQ